MDQVDRLLALMNVSVKLLNMDVTVDDDLETLATVGTDPDFEAAIENFTDTLIEKISADADLAAFAVVHLEFSTVFDTPYILDTGLIRSGRGLAKDQIIEILAKNKVYQTAKHTLEYYRSLAFCALSSGDSEAIQLCIDKIKTLSQPVG